MWVNVHHTPGNIMGNIKKCPVKEQLFYQRLIQPEILPIEADKGYPHVRMVVVNKLSASVNGHFGCPVFGESIDACADVGK